MKKYILYAIGEIMLVVIGILIALQIDDWNETRKIRSNEASLIQAIHEEFKENKKQFETVTFNYQNAKNASDKLVSFFPLKRNRTNIDTLSKYINRMFSNWTFNPSQSTIKSMIYTSSFDAISDQQLRLALISWSDKLIDYQEEELGAKYFFNNFTAPYLMQHFASNVNLKDKRLDLRFLGTTQFENIIWGNLYSMNQVLNESDQIRIAIDEIIELTKAEDK